MCVPVHVLSKRFGIPSPSLFRHRKNHLTPQIRAAILAAAKPSEIDLEQLQRSESEGLLASLVAQRARLQMLSEMAFEAHELHCATNIEKAITQSLELTSRLLGMIIQHHEVKSTSILISADYLKLRQTILTALRAHPQAARDVARALAELESEAASEIKANTDKGKPLLIEAEASPC
jgi:hypothetical protein